MQIISNDVDAELSRLSKIICSHWLPVADRRAAAKLHRQLCRQHMPMERRQFVPPDEQPYSAAGTGAPMQETVQHREQAAHSRWADSRNEGERIRACIVASLADGGTVTIEDVERAYGISHDMARKHLVRLHQRGVLELGESIARGRNRLHTYKLAAQDTAHVEA